MFGDGLTALCYTYDLGWDDVGHNYKYKAHSMYSTVEQSNESYIIDTAGPFIAVDTEKNSGVDETLNFEHAEG